MANQLSPELIHQLLSQESNDPFLTLLTLSHDSFSTIRLVNNTTDVVSRTETFIAFPFKIRFPVDDGESVREFSIDFDNVSLDLVDEIRSVTSPISIVIELVLSSIPDDVQMIQDNLKIQTITMNKHRVSAKIIVDDFLNIEMTGERYEPSNFPGLF
jgi:hypothetical protein